MNQDVENKDSAVFTVKCPNCKKNVVWDASSSYRPFCSKRCQLIDLGEWYEEEKVITTKIESD